VLFSTLAFVATPSLHRTIATDYEPQVQNLVAGRGLEYADGRTMDRYPPLYPVSLAALRTVSKALSWSESFLLFAFAAACLALASIFAFNLASLVVGPESAAVAAILFAINPQVLFGAVVPLSETPFLMTLNCAVWIFLYALARQRGSSWKLMLAAGLLGGIAMLLRPAGMFVPLIMAGVALCYRGSPARLRLQSSALLLIGVAVALLPWEFFAWQNSGKLIMVSTGGVPTMRDGFTFNNKAMRGHIWMPSGAQHIVDDVWRHYGHLPDYASIMKLVMDEFRQNPFGVAELYAFKAARSWYGTDSQQPLGELLNAIASLLYLVPGVIGIRNYFRKRKSTAPGILLVLLILYFWGLTTVTFSVVRYMVPAIAFICTFMPLSLPSAVRMSVKTLYVPSRHLDVA